MVRVSLAMGGVMLVFGDHARSLAPEADIPVLVEAARALAERPPGLARHAALVALFIRTGELAQGLADAQFARHGVDEAPPLQDAATAALLRLAQAIAASWDSAFATLPDGLEAPLARLASFPLPETIEARRPEGYAFYALYPELVLAAARACGTRFGFVLGVRSIGIGLAALVAAAQGGAPLASVRPVGHPFRRQVHLGASLAALIPREAPVAVVDEGPGLSGSSFAAAAVALRERGIERLHFFPSHRGAPGPEADATVRALWAATPRHVADFDTVIRDAPRPAHTLAHWCADLTGPALASLEDISGGLWRRHRPEGARLPSRGGLEPRKYLLRSATGVFLLRFAGLGAHGEATLRRARHLSQAGVTPPVLGLRHGFLVQEWREGARAPEPAGEQRPPFLARLGDYLALRATMPAPPDAGATLDELATVLLVNSREALGRAPDETRLRARAAALAPQVRRVETDNALHPWEWLRLPDGTVLKADAFDHCAGHDLIGCQDLAWDVAGAICAFDLSQAETAVLLKRLGGRVSPDLFAFLLPCHAAFTLGQFSLNPTAENLNFTNEYKVKLKKFLELEQYLINFI